jgi:tetratricopeptide (TPR) repeat protein
MHIRKVILRPIHCVLALVLTASCGCASQQKAASNAKAAIYTPQKKIESAEELVKNGLALKAKRDFAGAARELRRALKLDNKLAVAHFHLGTVLFALKNDKGAIKALEMARTLTPFMPEVYLALSLAFKRSGRATDAYMNFAMYQEMLRRARGEGGRKPASLTRPR